MPSSFSHAATGLAVAAAFLPANATSRYWKAAALCAVLPDLDAIGRPFGSIELESAFGGHRGLTHSIPFAIAFGAVVAWGFFRDPRWAEVRTRLWICFALATMTHGVLDAMNTRGEGVKFFSPFSSARFAFPWQPIDPYSAGAGIRNGPLRLAYSMANEMLWVVLPCAMFAGAVILIRRYRLNQRPPWPE